MSVFKTDFYNKVTATEGVKDSKEEKGSKKKRITERLQGLSDDLKNAFMDMTSWIEAYALIEATRGENLGLCKSRLIGISKLLNQAYVELLSYVEILPKPMDLEAAEDMVDLVKEKFMNEVGFLTFTTRPGEAEFSIGLILFSLDRKKREQLGKTIEHLYEDIPKKNWEHVVEILRQLIADLP